MKTALLFGASGMIGSYLLEELLACPDYESVTIVVRKGLNRHHPKLTTLIGDYQSLPRLKPELVGGDVFIALGTTRKNTPDQQLYYQVDHDYPVLAATYAKENGAKTVCMVTAVGADVHSSVFYIRTKGEVERDLLALSYLHTYIFRPSMLLGHRKEQRPFEKFLMNVFAVINPVFVGGLSKFKGIEGKAVAKAMIHAAKAPTASRNIYHWKEMQALL